MMKYEDITASQRGSGTASLSTAVLRCGTRARELSVHPLGSRGPLWSPGLTARWGVLATRRNAASAPQALAQRCEVTSPPYAVTRITRWLSYVTRRLVQVQAQEQRGKAEVLQKGVSPGVLAELRAPLLPQSPGSNIWTLLWTFSSIGQAWQR